MTIQAKFQGTCTKCGQRFAAGTRIEWQRGAGSAHVTCPGQPTPVAFRSAGFRGAASHGSNPTCFDCFDGSCNRH